MIIPGKRPLIAPSLLSSDFVRLADEIAAIEEAGADLLHIDVMDGHFVPNLTIGPPVIRAINKCAGVPLDVHLMITNPEVYIEEYAHAGADILTVHQEACIHLHRTVNEIRAKGMLAGVSLNPSTPVSVLEDIIKSVDMVLLMSVNPGFGGQSFIERTYHKVEQLRAMADRQDCPDLLIEVDGGVDAQNASTLVSKGVDILVSGSAVFSSGNYKDYIQSMR
jgi:ribulose-phosphate 3-epimerase